MATVTLTSLDAATFMYRSNAAVKPAVRASFSYSPAIQLKLQRRYPGAQFDGASKAWLVPNETMDAVAGFFAEHGFAIVVDGGRSPSATLFPPKPVETVESVSLLTRASSASVR